MQRADLLFPKSIRDRLIRRPRKRLPPSRRDAMLAGAGGVAALSMLAGSARHAQAEQIVRRRRLAPPPVATTARSLVNRTTFGFTMEMYHEAIDRGLEEYVEWQLDHELIADTEIEERLAGFDTLTMTSQQIYDAYQDDLAVPVLQLMRASLLRATYSQRQLYERMVQFWTDHFSIYILDGLVPFFKTAEDRDAIRANALGTFPDLLNASARSAAMLYYLDNYTNVVGHAQENYSRELMELHTMGVDGGYTQQDVEEVARCLTGWTIFDTPNFGEFAFWAPFHDTGAKTVLGVDIPAGGGESDGQTVLDILAMHPSTAAFISRKLCVRFLGYYPPDDVVDSVRDTYLSTGGDIKSMLRVILHPDTIREVAEPKIKRPFHLVASMLRSTQADVPSDTNIFLSALQIMGQAPFFWDPPNGYPDTLEAWSGSLVTRWQAAQWMFDGTLPVGVDLQMLLEDNGAYASGHTAPTMNKILTGWAMTDAELQLLLEFHADLPQDDALALEDTFGLATSLPAFQWY